jgi:hypothetical protein
MKAGLIFVAILVSFRYYNELCFITVKDSDGVEHKVLLGSASTYNFNAMISLRKQGVKCSVEYVGKVASKKDTSVEYNNYRFLGFDLE